MDGVFFPSCSVLVRDLESWDGASGALSVPLLAMSSCLRRTSRNSTMNLVLYRFVVNPDDGIGDCPRSHRIALVEMLVDEYK